MSAFMRMPCELRLMIYEHLFNAGEADVSIDTKDNPNSGTGMSGKNKLNMATSRTISIRNGKDNPFECTQCGHHTEHPANPYSATQKPNQTRTRYQIIDRSFARRCVETTYYMVNKGGYICAALMRVNKVVHDETAHVVYAMHRFDFGCDVEAVKPFLSDLSPMVRRLVTRIALYKKGPWMYDCWSDRCEWRSMCTYLRDHAFVEHLQLVVQAGRLSESREWEWEDDSPRELSSKDFALLVDIRHDTLHWVGDIVRLRSLRGVKVIPDYCTVPPPQTSNMYVFLAFSASVTTGFVEFLSDRLRLRN
ncbi:hypothetical protein NPX13_g2909 [Xylaria arbuscula]|uniref:Uncharacterized protein n=1 Tax=Xylaria arbuscula TaxID=114810 RepID=A0A9W8TNQ6_9PEZI|nr:hypothetical protein NPX13_g2909 [Xylaria arbuscula]